MLSKNKIKIIQSLERKKIRDEQNVFLAEGNKIVFEALVSGFDIELLVATKKFIAENNSAIPQNTEVIEADAGSIRKASLLQSPQEALAVIKKPEIQAEIKCKGQLTLALDSVQDPGNMGTILRIANWFGINLTVCSLSTVDVYNPKVVQASMGAIFRVKTIYTDLCRFLEEKGQSGIPVYGTFLDGKNIYNQEFSNEGILVMGNEGNGISAEVGQHITEKITIPSFAGKNSRPESLNVAVATAICCSEFRRK